MPIRFSLTMNLLVVTLGVACARPAPPAATPGSPAPAEPAPVAAPSAPQSEHHWTAKKGTVVITISDQPGPLVDSNAPPPPPGYPAPTNPYLSATCGGDVLGCSEAGTLLRKVHSARELVDALRKDGYAVTDG